MSSQINEKIDFRFIDEKDWQAFLQGGGTFGDAVDINSKEQEAIYALAYQKYNTAIFDKAASIFKLLLTLNHFEAKYYLGLGASQQAVKDYKRAGETYSFAALVFPDDPRFPYYAAECQMELGDWKSAGSGYELAVEISEKKEKYKIINENASKRVEVLKIKLLKENTKGEDS